MQRWFSSTDDFLMQWWGIFWCSKEVKDEGASEGVCAPRASREWNTTKHLLSLSRLRDCMTCATELFDANRVTMRYIHSMYLSLCILSTDTSLLYDTRNSFYASLFNHNGSIKLLGSIDAHGGELDWTLFFGHSPKPPMLLDTHCYSCGMQGR